MRQSAWRRLGLCGLTAMLVILGCQAATAPKMQCRGGDPIAPKIDPAKARVDARTALRRAAEDPDPFTRSYAMEALAQTLGAQAGGVFKQALRDEKPNVQFAAAVAIGDANVLAAKPDLVRMAEAEGPDKRVFCGVIYGLHRLGENKYTGELGRLLSHREAEVRANAAMIMGRMGEPSAIGPMKSILEDEQSDLVKVNLVEALAKLGDTANAQMLEAYTKGFDVPIRLIAIESLGRRGSRRAAAVLEELLDTRHPARVRVAAAGELARIKHDAGKATATASESYRLCVSGVRTPKAVMDASVGREDPTAGEEVLQSLRRLAAMALGWTRQASAVDVLHPLLASEDGGVRVASAMSILRVLGSGSAAPGGPPAPEDVAATQPTQPPEAPKPSPKLHSAGGKD